MDMHGYPSLSIPGPLGFAVLDVETTGFSPAADRVIEMAVVHTDATGVITDEWVARFNPGRPVGATFVHGIRDEDVHDQPPIGDLIPEIIARLRGRALVAHNAPFDMRFLRAEFSYYGWQIPEVPVFCTLDASTRYLPHLRRRRLADCCEAIGVDFHSAHAALSDARATAWLLAQFLDPAVPPPPHPDDLGLPVAATVVTWPNAPHGPPAPYEPPPKLIRNWRKRLSPSPPLLSLLGDYPLVEALHEGAPEGSIAYLELVLEVLEDGVVTIGEGHELVGVAQLYGLSPDDITRAHRGFLLAMGHLAVADGTVARVEREEMIEICRLLGESEDLIPGALSDARSLAATKSSEGLAPLPDGWALGEPIRVGDGVAFTGCDEAQRERFEGAARAAGVRVTGAVSGKTAVLVSDGSMDGTKAAAARKYCTRVVHPEEFDLLLRHVQPALESAPSGGRRASSSPPLGEVDLAEVRSWARAEGYEIGDRGRVRVDIIEAYVTAMQGEPEAQAPERAMS